MNIIYGILLECWKVVVESAPYLILGFAMAGLLYIFLSPTIVRRYLGRGKIKSVFMAAFLGAPIPLCSCGVLPAAVSLKQQGANDGATSAFLIATPETGLDSIAITYALFDPLMTVARPIAAIFTAIAAGLGVNFLGRKHGSDENRETLADPCRVDNCCSGIDCPPDVHRRHHNLREKIFAAVKYASTELVSDIAGWFLLGVLIAGLISYFAPADLVTRYLGGGLLPMLLMLVVGTPLYVCSTAATPIAVALVLKGLSPGAALVFLLAGPATNATALSVVGGILGKRTMAIYLGAIMVCSVLLGLAVDAIYSGFSIPIHPRYAEGSELLNPTLTTILAAVLLAYMLYLVARKWTLRLQGHAPACSCGDLHCSSALPMAPETRKSDFPMFH